MTGLPTETFLKNADLLAQIKQALSGTSTFTTDQSKSYRRIVVQVSTVVMEGAGAIIYYGETTSTDALISWPFQTCYLLSTGCLQVHAYSSLLQSFCVLEIAALVSRHGR